METCRDRNCGPPRRLPAPRDTADAETVAAEMAEDEATDLAAEAGATSGGGPTALTGSCRTGTVGAETQEEAGA